MSSIRRPATVLGQIAALVLIPAALAHAEWPHESHENLPIGTGQGTEYSRDAQPDGNGGMWLAWQDGGTGRPMLQHVGPDGEHLLGSDGLALSSANSNSRGMSVLPTADGGVIVAWEDLRAGPTGDIYGQRVSASGSLLWSSAGIPLARGPVVAVAVGNGGIIVRSVDGGETWTNVSSPTGQSLLGVSIVPGRILAVGDLGTFLESTDDGVTWTIHQSGGSPDLNAMDMYDPYTGVAVGDNGTTWRWEIDDWTPSITVNNTGLLGVSMPSISVAYAVGRDGRIARTIDGGISWDEQLSGVSSHLHDVCFTSPLVGTAVGVDGVIRRTEDGGSVWTPQPSGGTQTLLSVDFLDEQFGIATGYGGQAIYTTNGGDLWLPGVTPVNTWYMGVDITDADTAIAVGQNGIVIKTTDGGHNWTVKRPAGSSNDLWEVAAPGEVSSQSEPTLIDDGAGGAILVWRDNREGLTQMFAQRFDLSGNALWSAPVQVSDSPGSIGRAFAVPRGGGGAIVVWEDLRAPPHEYIFVQGVDLDGALVRATSQALCTTNTDKLSITAIADGQGAAIVAWVDRSTSPQRIRARRVTAQLTLWWDSAGSIVSVQESADQFGPALAPDGAGGAFVVWDENRSTPTGINVFAQRVDQLGNPRWPYADVRLTNASGTQYKSSVVSDGFGGAIVAWRDWRTLDQGLSAQSVSGDGVVRWTPDGVPVRVGAPGGLFLNQAYDFIVVDGRGGALFAWSDTRDEEINSTDVYAQNVDRHGFLGSPSAQISSIVDVPGDQGGFVTVNWSASYLDDFPEQVVTEYSIWRRSPEAAIQEQATTRLDGTDRRRLAQAAVRAELAGLDPELIAAQTATGWSFVGTSPAAYQASYGYEAPTYGVQTPTETALTEFQVMVHTEYSHVFWVSGPASGASVDDLAPDAPRSLLAADIGGMVELVWNDGEAQVEDVAHYRVYRGATSTFTADPSSLLDTSTQKNYVDPSPGSSPVYYRVTAMDVHGNESASSNLAGVSSVTAAAPDLGTLVSFALRPPFPNPMSGSSSFRFSLPAGGDVRVELFDLAGRRVYEKRLARLSRGWHESSLGAIDASGRRLASGTYLLRVSHGGVARTSKVVVAR